MSATIDLRSLRAANGFVRSYCAQRLGDELDGRIRVDGPVRNEQRTCAGMAMPDSTSAPSVSPAAAAH